MVISSLWYCFIVQTLGLSISNSLLLVNKVIASTTTDWAILWLCFCNYPMAIDRRKNSHDHNEYWRNVHCQSFVSIVSLVCQCHVCVVSCVCTACVLCRVCTQCNGMSLSQTLEDHCFSSNNSSPTARYIQTHITTVTILIQCILLAG